MAERELAAAEIQGLVALTAFNSPVYLSYATLVDLIRERLGQVHAQVFARPTMAYGRIVWTTPVPGPIRPWHTLKPEERQALDPVRAALGADLAAFATTLARAGLNTRDGNLAHLLQSAMEVSSPDHVYAVGDNLVLAFWGFRSSDGRIDPFTASLPARLTPRPRRWWLLLLPLLLALGMAVWFSWPQPHLPPVIAPVPAPKPAPILPPAMPAPPPPQPLPTPVKTASPPSPPPPPKPKPQPPRRIARVPPPSPPKNTQPCNQNTASGGSGVTRTRHYLGPKPGRVDILYDMFSIPDDLKVFYKGRQLASSGGFAYHRGAVSFDWYPPANGTPADDVIDVVVTGGTAPPNLLTLLLHENPSETKWVYRVSCPQ